MGLSKRGIRRAIIRVGISTLTGAIPSIATFIALTKSYEPVLVSKFPHIYVPETHSEASV